MESKKEFTNGSSRTNKHASDTRSVDNIKFEWKWADDAIRQEEKEIKQFAKYKEKIEIYAKRAEEINKTILAIESEYNRVVALDAIHFFNPSHFPKNDGLETIIAHAFSGGVRTMRALQQLQYITANRELSVSAPEVFQKAFANYNNKNEINAEEKNNWSFGWF